MGGRKLFFFFFHGKIGVFQMEFKIVLHSREDQNKIIIWKQIVILSLLSYALQKSKVQCA